jgi:hypothetical protein
MIPRVLIGVLVLVATSGAPAVAQEVAADVRAWDGQSWHLGSPTLEVFFTMSPLSSGGGAPAPAPPAGPPGAGGPSLSPGMGGLSLSPGAMVVGTPSYEPTLVAGPGRGQGRRQAEIVTLHRAGVEIHVPLESIAVLTFSREPVRPSSLPPYVAGSHYRYAATANLVDGSRVEGDYVNLGTSVLRGTTRQGVVDIPWAEIEVIRFQR